MARNPSKADRDLDLRRDALAHRKAIEEGTPRPPVRDTSSRGFTQSRPTPPAAADAGPAGFGEPVDNVAAIRDGLVSPEWLSRLPGTGGGVNLDRMGSHFRAIVEQRDGLAKTEALIMDDENLSATGKASKIEEARTRTRQALAGIQNQIDNEVSATLEKAKNARATTPNPIEAMTAAVRASEIRSMIERQAGGDSLEMTSIIRDATFGGDLETIDAVLGAPSIWRPRSLVGDIDALRETRATFAHRELGSEIVDLVTAEKDLYAAIEATTFEMSVEAVG